MPSREDRRTHIKGLLLAVAGILALSPDSLLIRLIAAGDWTLLFWRGLLLGAGLLIAQSVLFQKPISAAFRSIGKKGIVAAAVQALGTIFFVLAIGMATGTGQHLVAVLGTLFIGTVLLALSGMNFGSFNRREFLLQFQYSHANTDSAPYIQLFNSYCSKFKLINIHTVGDTDILEMSYYLTMKKPENGGKMVHMLREIDGISNVNLFYDEE